MIYATTPPQTPEQRPPAPTTARERRRIARLNDILEAAEAQVVRAGFDSLSIQGVAQAVDLTPGALYRYFDSKSALIIALTERVVSGFASDLGRVLETLPARSPLARVAAAALTYGELATEAPHRFGLLSMLLADARVLVPEAQTAAPAMTAATTALDPIVRALEHARSLGLLSDGDAAERALVLMASSHGILQLRKQAQRLPQLLDVQVLLRRTVAALLVGWGATPDDANGTISALDEGGPLLRRLGERA